MSENEISIGRKVRYYSIKGIDKYIETVITSEPWGICGTMCCKVEGVRGGVSIDHLEQTLTQNKEEK